MASKPPKLQLAATSAGVEDLAKSCRHKNSTGVLADGLCVTAFDKAFDDHFQINSDLIEAALQGSCHECCASFPSKIDQPAAWGIKVSFLSKIWQYIQEDARGYAAAHKIGEHRRHHCLVTPCLWKHASEEVQSSRNGMRSSFQQMRADMHLVVQRYVKPWTQPFDVGLSLVLNAGSISWSHKDADAFCMATTFISHSWGEQFEDFAKTVQELLDPATVVWICSFALWQHGDIAQSLSSLESCPFAVAMRACRRVLVITDTSAAVMERCWVVFEAALAHSLGKDYDIGILNDGDENAWQIVGKKLEKLDVQACKASDPRDKVEIISYIKEHAGGIAALNETVRHVAKTAMQRAKLMAAATTGDLSSLWAASCEELSSWRSIRGRSVTHVAAAHSRIAAMVEVLEMTDYDHLDLLDEDSRTPLGVAVESSQLASVVALLGIGADIEVRSEGGLTALHLAAMQKQSDITQAIVDWNGELEAEACYNGRTGYRPLMIAAHEGNAQALRLLIESRATLDARTSTGASALHVAAWNGHSEAAAALIAGRADVDIKPADEFSRSPLTLALNNGHMTVVGLLLGAQADASSSEASGRAMSLGNRSIRRLFKMRSRTDSMLEAASLISHSHQQSRSSMASYAQSRPASMTSLEDSETSVYTVDESEQTPERRSVTFAEEREVVQLVHESGPHSSDDDIVLVEWSFSQRSSALPWLVISLASFCLAYFRVHP
eukprot:TRINITY_DN112262_c0_g1_i1.p1 TRINITY_DN112262_c0_g1~~TRINITY_DN112262_c0_g1_i1.p1  ORF type:complete len:723 (+),score=156.37 TRINITY_DN112262_c0_g1_i1:30-2198(+)